MPGLNRLCVFNLEDVLPYVFDSRQRRKEDMPDLARNFCGHQLWLTSMRMRCFKERGVKCAHCGIEGCFFALERTGKVGRPHLNLYAIRGSDKKQVLMTFDHVMPQALGGPSSIDNAQTLCCFCNCKKADRFSPEDQKVFDAQVREPARLAAKEKFLREKQRKSLASAATGAINVLCQDDKTSVTGKTEQIIGEVGGNPG